MPSYRSFRQIKIRHIFIMQFGGYFIPVKFSGHTIFSYHECTDRQTDRLHELHVYVGLAQARPNNHNQLLYVSV